MSTAAQLIAWLQTYGDDATVELHRSSDGRVKWNVYADREVVKLQPPREPVHPDIAEVLKTIKPIDVVPRLDYYIKKPNLMSDTQGFTAELNEPYTEYFKSTPPEQISGQRYYPKEADSDI